MSTEIIERIIYVAASLSKILTGKLLDIRLDRAGRLVGMFELKMAPCRM